MTYTGLEQLKYFQYKKTNIEKKKKKKAQVTRIKIELFLPSILDWLVNTLTKIRPHLGYTFIQDLF